MSTHDTDRDYPVIDRVRDDDPDDPGTTVLPVDADPAYDGAAPDTPDTDADPDRFDDTADPDRVDDTADTTGTDVDADTGRFDDTTDAGPFDDTDSSDHADVIDVANRSDAEVAPVPMPLPDDASVTPTAVDESVASDEFEDTWRELQVTFVDDPAAAVQGAAELLERAVAELRGSLEGTDSTEDLRTAFRRYRDIFRTLH